MGAGPEACTAAPGLQHLSEACYNSRMWLLFIIAGCSEYDIIGPDGDVFTPTDPSVSTPAPPVPVAEAEAGLDIPDAVADPPWAPSGSGTLDIPTPPEDTGVEIPPTEVYCTSFDDLKDWSTFGDGDWFITKSYLEESKGGLYQTVAHVDDLGGYDRWGLEVSTAFVGSLNDFAGFVFAADPMAETFYAVRWDDPNDAYNRHEPPGAIDLSRCAGANCYVAALDRSAPLVIPADGTWVTWSLTVDGDLVEVEWNGTVVFSQSVPEVAGVGPGVVGLYSNDNDGGVFYDDFCAWVEKS